MIRIRALDLRGYRNLADASLAVPGEGLALVGENAQGKTNFLECLYYLEILRSFRGARDGQLVRFGAEHFRVVGELSPGTAAPSRIAAAFERGSRRKKVTVDGIEPPRLGDAIGTLGAVLFTPEDVRMVSDGPGGRRRFLDIVLSLAEPGYLDALQRFRQVLAQRNAALREGPASGVVEAWDPMFAKWAARVMLPRARWLEEGATRFAENYAAISGGPAASLQYEPGVAGVGSTPPTEEVEGLVLEALAAARDRDRRHGSTSVGPHRDEFRIRIEASDGDRDLRDFGSGGQRRTAALALRLVEAETVRARRAREPLLLMDDVFAELDEGRSERVLALLDQTAVGQVVLTAPKESELRFRREALPRWRIRDGAVEA